MNNFGEVGRSRGGWRDEVVTPRRQAQRDRLNEISGAVVAAAIEVHRGLGPGLLESIYQKALAIELRAAGYFVETEVIVEAEWRGQSLDAAFRADLIVERCLLIELKAVNEVTALFKSQVRTYLKLLDFRLGLLINFNSIRLIDGLERIPNQF